MQITFNRHATTNNTDYHAEVPAIYAPIIVGRKDVEGETFYVDNNGKLYRPLLYDRMFKTRRGMIFHSKYKGLNPNKNHRK